jgi:hypothetical protein
MNFNGFHSAIPFEQYAKWPEMNYSTLKHMLRSPLSYRWHRDNPTVATPAMQMGTACHRAILEPERTGDFAVWTGGRRQGKEWEAFKVENDGKQLLTVEERDHIAGMCAAVHKNPTARRYLRTGEAELCALWHDPAAKRDFKARLDRFSLEDNLLIDVKTTRDCRPFRFGADAFRLGYHIQSSLYSDGIYYLTGKLPKVVVVAVENKPPFETVVYLVPDDVLQQGKEDCSRLLQRLAECERTNTWPPDIEGEAFLSLPTYAYQPEGDDLTDLELVAM